MTSSEAIPDFNSNNPISETDSQVTSDQTEESTVTLEDESVSNHTHVEENSTDTLESVSHQTNSEENSTITSQDDLVSHQTNIEENPVPENLSSASIEEPTDDEISMDTTLLNNTVDPKIQVEIASEKDRLVLILPTLSQTSVSEYSWSEIWQQMKLRLLAQQRFFSEKISVHLVANDRLLDSRQLQDIAQTLSEMSLQLKSVGTSRRQTAIAAAGGGYSVEQLQPKKAFSFESSSTALPPAEPLYLQMTVRSGVEIRHRGSVIILGDINPGGIVVADGDILIWGRLRGVAHAGAQGNSECTIMALQMEPTQLRIANALARAPEKAPTQQTAEVAYMTTQGIRIASANDFSKNQLTRLNQEP
ncbi:MAG: septum site-determining protein MinC [Rivularia sp. (in: cyanobacteria)]